MKTRQWITFISLLTVLIMSPGVHAASSSQDFKIVVYIPAIPGINAPLENLTADYPAETTAGISFYVVTEELVENGQNIIRETIVPR